MLNLVQYLLGGGSGILVGFTLALVGGGGSILAVPLMVYVVGVRSPHVAIGTSALAVATNAATGVLNHAWAQTIRWRCAIIYAAAGIVGAFAGSTLGKAFDGQKLLFLFALVMIVVGALMLRRRDSGNETEVQCNVESAPKVVGYGFGTGIFSGFFGIGGGFLIVPGLIASTGMPIINAIGSSLVPVTAFGLTTAVNYAFSGLVDWMLAAAFIAGGIIGGFGGARLATLLAREHRLLTNIFATLIFIVAGYMIWRTAGT